MFYWILFNEDNYNACVRSGLLENIPFKERSPKTNAFLLMSNIIHRFIRVSPLIQDQVNNRIRSMGNQTTIGFHIRKGDRHSDFHETRQFLLDTDVKSFSHCSIVNSHPKAVLFVASDSSEAKQKVIATTTRRVFTSSKRARHSNAAMRKEKNVGILFDSFIDLLTVASCDYMVGTWKSSFSVVAGAFQGKVPYFVTRMSKCFQPETVSYSLFCYT